MVALVKTRRSASGNAAVQRDFRQIQAEDFLLSSRTV